MVLRLLRRLGDAWRESTRRYQAALDEDAVDEYFRGREEAEAEPEVGAMPPEPDDALRRRRRGRRLGA